MSDVVIVEAVRTPVGKRNGGLSTVHPADLLATVQKAAIERSGIDPAAVGQVVTGCVSQVGEQAFNIGRTAWLSAGLPLTVAATTDAQCGSSSSRPPWPPRSRRQRRRRLRLAGGVEVMSRVPIGSSGRKDLGLGIPIPKSYFPQYEMTSQFEGAERIADKWGISRDDTDAFGLRSQENAATAWAEDRFGTQIIPVEAPDVHEEGQPTGSTHTVTRDEGHPRPASRSSPSSSPSPGPRPHTGSSSQISDGAAAVSSRRPSAPSSSACVHARIVDTCLVGVDPVLMLTGPIDATQRLFERTGLGVDDIDVAEINEAFRLGRAGLAEGARVQRRADQLRGGAIALGHPLEQRRRAPPRPSTSWSAPVAATGSCPCAARWRPRHRHDHRTLRL